MMDGRHKMLKSRLSSIISEKRCTLLGVGPMSLNCVDASVEIANESDIPLMLIASRRQIDSEGFGGGYVNNWTTSQFAEYIFQRDKKGKIILCRDHGGPWQNSLEIKQDLGLKKAMESAKISYKSDIDSGFQVLHIDPSIDIHGDPTLDEILDRVFELYEYCYSYASQQNKDVIFEIGTEEQSAGGNTPDQINTILKRVNHFCIQSNFPTPTFIVAQCGTRVVETQNVGTFDSPFRVQNELPAQIQLPKILSVCQSNNVFMKEHNADYLSNEALKWHPRLGIHAANVAPEFGVSETRALVSLLKSYSLSQYLDEFYEIAYNSFKWQKWLSEDSSLSDEEKSVIAGHYVFATQPFKSLKSKMVAAFHKRGIDLDKVLVAAVKKSIYRYLRPFRLL